jgi:hypothetical protein
MLVLLAVVLAFAFGLIKLPNNQNYLTGTTGILTNVIQSTSFNFLSNQDSVLNFDENGLLLPINNSYDQFQKDSHGNTLYFLASKQGYYSKILKANVLGTDGKMLEKIDLNFDNFQTYPQRMKVYPASYALKDALGNAYFLTELNQYPNEFYGNLQFNENMAFCLLYDDNASNISLTQTNYSGDIPLKPIDFNIEKNNFPNSYCGELSFKDWYRTIIKTTYSTNSSMNDFSIVLADKEYFLDGNHLNWGYFDANGAKDIGTENITWTGQIAN